MWEFRAKKSDRLDRLLRGEAFPGSEWLSRQAWDWLLENGFIEVDGRKCSKSGLEVPLGASVSVRFPAESLGLRKADTSAALLWNDSHLAIFSKDCGVPTVPIFPWDSTAFASQVARTLEHKGLLSSADFAALSEPPSLEGGLLQRLDNDTSGIVCAALDPAAKLLFRRLFSSSLVEKTYLAIVSGDLSKVSGSHELWLDTSSPKVKASLQPPSKNSKEPSRIRIEVKKSSGARALLKIATSQGARHVVRASLAALGAPLLGDELYGGEKAASFHQLHAVSLQLKDKDSYPGFPSSVEAPLPRSFLDSLRNVGLE